MVGLSGPSESKFSIRRLSAEFGNHSRSFRQVSQAFKRKSKTGKAGNDGAEDFEFRIPTGDSVIGDIIIQTQLNGTWHSRRMVYNKQIIAFALEDDDTMIDEIPLSGIESIESIQSQEKDHELEHTQDEMYDKNTLRIKTLVDSNNAGRMYYLHTSSEDQCEVILRELTDLAESARRKTEDKSKFRQSQDRVLRIIDSTLFKKATGLVIVATFACCIAEAQLVGAIRTGTAAADKWEYIFNTLQAVFTFIFAFELMLNAYANWFERFIHSWWNWLDGFVVVVSLLAFGSLRVPVTMVRFIRLIRIVRVFGRLRQLNKLIRALTSALLPMVNAFTLLVVIASIYAVMGVSFFGLEAPEEFGLYDRAFIALFRITAGEPWPADLDVLDADGSVNWHVALFLVTYIMMVNWIILQVSVAVLVDHFITCSHLIDREAELERKAARVPRGHERSPLEPLVLRLVKSFVDGADLSVKIKNLFRILDKDDTGSLSSQKFCAAIKNLSFTPRIHISDSDFVSLTHNGALCNEEGRLGPTEFERVMREQVRLYTQTAISSTLEDRAPTDAEFAQLGALKLLLMEFHAFRPQLPAYPLSPPAGPVVPSLAASPNFTPARASLVPPLRSPAAQQPSVSNQDNTEISDEGPAGSVPAPNSSSLQQPTITAVLGPRRTKSRKEGSIIRRKERTVRLDGYQWEPGRNPPDHPEFPILPDGTNNDTGSSKTQVSYQGRRHRLGKSEQGMGSVREATDLSRITCPQAPEAGILQAGIDNLGAVEVGVPAPGEQQSSSLESATRRPLVATSFSKGNFAGIRMDNTMFSSMDGKTGEADPSSPARSVATPRSSAASSAASGGFSSMVAAIAMAADADIPYNSTTTRRQSLVRPSSAAGNGRHILRSETVFVGTAIAKSVPQISKSSLALTSPPRTEASMFVHAASALDSNQLTAASDPASAHRWRLSSLPPASVMNVSSADAVDHAPAAVRAATVASPNANRAMKGTRDWNGLAGRQSPANDRHLKAAAIQSSDSPKRTDSAGTAAQGTWSVLWPVGDIPPDSLPQTLRRTASALDMPIDRTLERMNPVRGDSTPFSREATVKGREIGQAYNAMRDAEPQKRPQHGRDRSGSLPSFLTADEVHKQRLLLNAGVASHGGGVGLMSQLAAQRLLMMDQDQGLASPGTQQRRRPSTYRMRGGADVGGYDEYARAGNRPDPPPNGLPYQGAIHLQDARRR